MERVTISIDEPALKLVKEQASDAGTSVSAYIAQAAHDRALAEFYQAAAVAEGPVSGEEIARDAARITAKHSTGEQEVVSGAA